MFFVYLSVLQCVIRTFGILFSPFSWWSMMDVSSLRNACLSTYVHVCVCVPRINIQLSPVTQENLAYSYRIDGGEMMKMSRTHSKDCCVHSCDLLRSHPGGNTSKSCSAEHVMHRKTDVIIRFRRFDTHLRSALLPAQHPASPLPVLFLQLWLSPFLQRKDWQGQHPVKMAPLPGFFAGFQPATGCHSIPLQGYNVAVLHQAEQQCWWLWTLCLAVFCFFYSDHKRTANIYEWWMLSTSIS